MNTSALFIIIAFKAYFSLFYLLCELPYFVCVTCALIRFHNSMLRKIHRMNIFVILYVSIQ